VDPRARRVSALSRAWAITRAGRPVARREPRIFCRLGRPVWASDELSKKRLPPPHQALSEGNPAPDSAYAFFVFRKEGDVLMGGCTLSKRAAGLSRQCCALGYWIGERYARQGYMFDCGARIGTIWCSPRSVCTVSRRLVFPPTNPRKNLLSKGRISAKKGFARRYLQINGEWARSWPYSLCSRTRRLLG